MFFQLEEFQDDVSDVASSIVVPARRRADAQMLRRLQDPVGIFNYFVRLEVGGVRNYRAERDTVFFYDCFLLGEEGIVLDVFGERCYLSLSDEMSDEDGNHTRYVQFHVKATRLTFQKLHLYVLVSDDVEASKDFGWYAFALAGAGKDAKPKVGRFQAELFEEPHQPTLPLVRSKLTSRSDKAQLLYEVGVQQLDDVRADSASLAATRIQSMLALPREAPKQTESRPLTVRVRLAALRNHANAEDRLIYFAYLVDSLGMLVDTRGYKCYLTDDWRPSARAAETRALIDREIVFTCRVHAQDRTSLMFVAQLETPKQRVEDLGWTAVPLFAEGAALLPSGPEPLARVLYQAPT